MRSKKAVVLLLIGVGLLVGFWSQRHTPQSIDESFVEPVNFEYYPPKEPKNTMVILLHGGSWMAGDKQQLYGVGQYLSEHGMSVVNMDYRLAPAWQFDAPLRDIATIIKQVNENKEVYALTDDYRLVLLGFSAGGHLATQFCVTEEDYETRQVDDCISLAGIYDLARIVNNQDGPLLKEVVVSFLGTTAAKKASPMYRVASGEPTRFLLVRGDQDNVVSSQQQGMFVETLRNKRVIVEEMIVVERDHLGIFSTISLGDVVAQKILGFIGR